MSDAVERVGKGVRSVWEKYPNHAICGRGPIDASGARRWAPAIDGPSSQEFARAALLAALDPEDEALRKALLIAMGFYCEPGLKFSAPAHDQARAAISALREQCAEAL